MALLGGKKKQAALCRDCLLFAATRKFWLFYDVLHKKDRFYGCGCLAKNRCMVKRFYFEEYNSNHLTILGRNCKNFDVVLEL